MFIGIITEKVLDSIRRDSQIGTFITLEDAAAETGRICDAYKDEDIDLTILLTHIGIESDMALAAMLKPEWGVDMILGAIRTPIWNNLLWSIISLSLRLQWELIKLGASIF